MNEYRGHGTKEEGTIEGGTIEGETVEDNKKAIAGLFPLSLESSLFLFLSGFRFLFLSFFFKNSIEIEKRKMF